ncbi:cell division protein FtsQ/DivIB [Roseovarius salis]|uniref:cell division protein FtsQ/DivIB n=1 Tax=Roseovarius salis TaxID=3376063 RepID=UPI0037C4F2F1
MQQVDRRPDPAPSRLAYRLQRLLLTPLFRRLMRIGVPFGLALAAGTAYLADDARQEKLVMALTDLRHRIETRPEFMVRLLAVEGASAPVEARIREIFPFELPTSSFDIDIDDLRAQIAALPAVADADLRIRRGGTMVAAITERKPVAIWRNDEGLGVVDREGVVVSDGADLAARSDLPVIAGAGANRDVPGALDILQAARPLGDSVLGLVRMGERRWDVVLDRDRRILLPERRPVRALERVIVLDDVHDLLERDIAAVDMRLPARPTVRMNPAAVDEWWRLVDMMTGTDDR